MQKLPDMRSSPGCLVTRSDSPVSSDSSTSMRPSPTIGPSTTTWSPGSSRSTSPSTTSDGSISATSPVAQHVRLGPQQDRHLVHHALGADLLEQADDGVGADHEHDGERVERLAQDQEQDPEEVEEVVDEVEDVVADDAPVGAAGADLDVVALAGGAPPLGLSGAEAGDRRRYPCVLSSCADRTRTERAARPATSTAHAADDCAASFLDGAGIRLNLT